jgi:hypothetical protein
MVIGIRPQKCIVLAILWNLQELHVTYGILENFVLSKVHNQLSAILGHFNHIQYVDILAKKSYPVNLS